MQTHHLLELNSNENSLGMAESARAAIIDALDIGFRYPDDQRAALINKIAEIHGISTGHLSLGNGSSENIRTVVQMLHNQALRSGQRFQVIVPHPTFAYAEVYAALLGVGVVKVALMPDSYDVDMQRMQQVADEFDGISLFYLCNPNNPTATLMNTAKFKAWVAAAPDHHYFLIDEAYAEYVTDPSFESGIAWVRQGLSDNIIVLRTFSKLCALAGMRVGYAIANPSLLKTIEAFMSIDNTNLAAAVAALATLEDKEYLALSLATTNESRQMMASVLDELGLRYLPSQANFIFHDIRGELDDESFGGVAVYISRMRDHGIVVGRAFAPIDCFNRLTLGTPEEMAILIDKLKLFRQQGWV